MPTLQVHCYKGTRDDETTIVDLDTGTTLDGVRQSLTSSGFMPTDDAAKNIGYRFVAFNTKKTGNLQDVLINQSVEHLVPLSGVLGPANQLVITNEYATSKPDLMGIGTSMWTNRYIGASCSLNMTDPEAIAKNQSIQAFQPVMLTNVIPTSEKVSGIYDNVCVCCDGSVVEFTINSWGSAGFQFFIGAAAGEPIIQDLNICFRPEWGGVDKYMSTGAIRRWEFTAKNITIAGTDEISIPSGQTLQYQKVTFKTIRITQWSNSDGLNISSNTNPPPLAAPVFKHSEKLKFLTLGNEVYTNIHSLANAIVIPGEGIKPGTPTQGGGSGQQWGAPITGLTTDTWENALGEIVVFFFVFKTHADAVKTIDGYNAPDPSLWK